MRMARALLGITSFFLLAAQPAWATYSVVAADRTSGQVGGAVTSCAGTFDVSTVYGGVPGRGAIHAQAALNTAGRDEGMHLLELGETPADVIAAITAPAFDARASTRQYGVVDLDGRSAGWTGPGAQDYKDDRQGSVDTFTYSVQGNILTSARVIEQTEAGFRAPACDLAERLMRALELGAANEEGDSRCTETKGIPSDGASIEVDPPGMAAGTYLRLGVRGTGTTNPLVLLRAMFDEWRTTHPCPDASGADAGDGARPPAEARDGGGGGAGDGGAGDGAGGARDASFDGDASPESVANGCGCGATAASAPTALTLGLFVGGVLVAGRRRRR